MVRPPTGLNLEERIRWYGWTVTESGCWEFNGPKRDDGYGVISYLGEKHVYVHRAVFALWVEPIKAGNFVRHKKCDNPPCINPDHLRQGSHQDNMKDMVTAGRSRRNDKHHNVRLSLADVQEIKELSAGDLLTQYMIAEVFGVAQSHISAIVNGKKRVFA